MPRSRSLSRKQAARLALLPRLPNLSIEGGIRTLPLYVREGTETFQPRMAMWVDSTQGFIRGTELIASPHADGIDETLQALLAAIGEPVPSPPEDIVDGLLDLSVHPRDRKQAPVQGPRPGLPAVVRVDDQSVAAAARDLLAPLAITVDYVHHVPALDEAFAAMASSMGADPAGGPPPPFAWTIDPALLPPLYKAAGGFARRAPWTYMPDYPPLSISLGKNGPQDDVQTLYACILGGGGEVMGVALYYSLDAVRQAALQGIDLVEQDEELQAAVDLLQQAGGPLAELPAREARDLAANLLDQEGRTAQTVVEELSDSLLMFFDPPDETDPSYLDWLASQDIKLSPRGSVPMFFRTSPGAAPRPPGEREIIALTTAVEALSRFFTQHSVTVAGPLLPASSLSHSARVSTPRGKTTVEVTFPPAGTTWDEWGADDQDADLDGG